MTNTFNSGEAGREAGGRLVAGRYRLTERLGGGGSGVVWQAHDETLRRTVAVKEVILPAALDEAQLEEIRQRTMREGRIAAKLHHPQLIAVYDVIEDEGRPYIVMEYLPSTSLSRVLDEREILPPDEAARLGAQAAAALAAAHAAGVVHRDVKPANILVGDNETVKITDFGVSRVVEDVTGTSTGTFVGTPAYLAPEVAQGREVTFASDVYSLGATLYTAVEGSPPAGRIGNPIKLLHQIASGTVVPPKRAGRLTDVLMRLLNADPAQRPTMEETRVALTEIGDGRAPAPAPAPTPVPVPQPPAQPAPSRRRGILALAALFVLVAVTTTLVILLNEDDAPPPAAGSSTTTTTTTTTGAEQSTPDSPPASETADESEAPETASAPPEDPQPPADPAAAITDYYALMPGNPDVGWTRLTANFQASPAGGRASYVAYWNSLASTRATQVDAQGATVEVTIDYAYKDGRNIRERHRYQLVDQNGGWLIDAVDVLSSTTLP